MDPAIPDRARGRPIRYGIGDQVAWLRQVRELERGLGPASDGELREAAAALRAERSGSVPTPGWQARGFALVTEISRRQLGLRPYDEQLAAGRALYDGDLAQMQTGEGKTLAAVAPLFLRALEERGAHALTFNDYLAQRDAHWMGPIYRELGVSVGIIQEGMPATERRRAYAADITYATAKEAASTCCATPWRDGDGIRFIGSCTTPSSTRRIRS